MNLSATSLECHHVMAVTWYHRTWDHVTSTDTHIASWDRSAYSSALPPMFVAPIPQHCLLSGLCSTHESWVKFDSTLTQMSRVRSRVGRENPGYESSQSRITLIVIWVRVESTGYCLSQSWVTDFSKRKRQDLAIICNFTEKEPTYSYIRPHPPPPVNNFFPN